MLTACAYCDELHCICPHDDDADLAPPEPPVGSGWFHDGVLYQRWADGQWYGPVGDWDEKSWVDLQPGSPAIPASTPGKGEW